MLLFNYGPEMKCSLEFGNSQGRKQKNFRARLKRTRL